MAGPVLQVNSASTSKMGANAFVYVKPDSIKEKMLQAFSRSIRLIDEFVKQFARAFSKRIPIPVYWGNPFSVKD